MIKKRRRDLQNQVGRAFRDTGFLGSLKNIAKRAARRTITIPLTIAAFFNQQYTTKYGEATSKYVDTTLKTDDGMISQWVHYQRLRA